MTNCQPLTSEIPFPAVEPSQFAFTMPRHPISTAVSESGIQDQRLWSTVAVDGALDLEFTNIPTSVATLILATHSSSYSGLLPLLLPDILFAGITAADRAFIKSVTTDAGLQWFWPIGQNAPSPRASLTYRHRCTLPVRLEARLQNTLDFTLPTPLLSLAADTGQSATDGVTSNPIMNVARLKTGAIWSYSTNQGVTWTQGTGASFTLPAGEYASGAIQARQSDEFENQSCVGQYASQLLVYSPLITPAAPGVQLTVTGVRGRAAYLTRFRARVSAYIYYQGGNCQAVYTSPDTGWGPWVNLAAPPTGITIDALMGTCPISAPGLARLDVRIGLSNGQSTSAHSFNSAGNATSGPVPYVGAEIVPIFIEFDTTDPKPGAIP
jgi:hypothetical protein